MQKQNGKYLKVVLLGSSSAGKSSLLQRLADGTSPDDCQTPATVGLDFKVLPAMELDNQLHQIWVWDTAGQERFDCMIANYMRGAHLALICCSLEKENFQEAVLRWFNNFAKDSGEEILFVLVGCQRDRSYEGAVQDLQGNSDLRDKFGKRILDTSAKTDSRADLLAKIRPFLVEAAELYHKRAEKTLVGLDVSRNSNNKAGCC